MKIETEIKELSAKVCKKWQMYKDKETVNKEESWADCSSVRTLNGYETAWDNPDLLWVWVEIQDGSYDGAGLQVGLSRDGKFYWEYQSHCSCDGFGDTSGHDNELCLGCSEKPKSYELSNLPADWEKIVKVNLEQILSL